MDTMITGHEPRELDELLKLETYQGMTDSEIELIISFRCSEFARDLEFKRKVNYDNERLALLSEYNREQTAHAKKVLETLVGDALKGVENG